MHGLSSRPRFRWHEPPKTDMTLFSQIAEELVKAFPRNLIHINMTNREIRIQSVSMPHVVHKLTFERV